MAHHYLLIDGVLRKGVIAELYESGENIEVEPLYIGTRWQEAHDLGPVLAEIPTQSKLLFEARNDKDWLRSSSFLSSNTNLREVSDHLREFICVRGSAGSQSLLRFADPLVTWHWLASYAPAQYPHLLGPITRWEVVIPQAKWEPDTAPRRTAYAAGDHPLLAFERALMDEPQESALQQAYQWQLKTRLYDWLQIHEPIRLQQQKAIGSWLDDRLQSAEQAGLSSERSIAIWAMLSLEQGDNFAHNPSSAYSQWQANTPQPHGLPTEVNLQTFFNEHA